MKLIEKEGPFGDQTCIYDVVDYKAITVSDFIREVINERPNEYGVFQIYGKRLPFNPQYEYKYGKFNFSQLHTFVSNETVVRVTSHGGWSNMDYNIYITA